MNFELAKARNELESVKEALLTYLQNSYSKEESPEDFANKTYKVLEKQVDNICKRKPVFFDFGPGADPEWYADILAKFSKWIELEIKIAEILNNEMDTYL